METVVQDMYSLGSITLAELAEARVHVQDLVVRLACERATEAELQEIEANIDRTEQLTKAGRFLERVECSREFYRLLGAATHNAVMAMMVQSVTEILMQFVNARVSNGGKPTPRLVATRREFLQALRARDSERATRLMRAHLQAIHRMLAEPPTATRG
jgi:DNA-binding GntR family transcriptional regulator